ncbi:MAG: class I SAM-dependent methyltransferase [Spirochaetes bacterium]|nr:class I SAM-dependent methyltransferase [Spirochaetota bacterium]
MVKTWSSTPGVERTEGVACALCGAREPEPYLACEAPGGSPFAFARCRRCGLVYQDPRPVFEDLRRRYGPEYFAYELANEENFFGLMQLGLADIAFDRVTAGMPSPRTFLDVGCATGMLLQWVQGRGWEVQGADICRESAEYGERVRGVRIHAGTLEEARFADGSFAVVHFSHLIEHLDDPRAFLREVRRVLRDDGRAVITTPNIAGLQARLFGARWRSAIVDHLVLFSRPTLRRMLAEEGFVVEREVTWGGLAAGSAPSWLKRPADRLAKRWGFGDVMLFLARKA